MTNVPSALKCKVSFVPCTSSQSPTICDFNSGVASCRHPCSQRAVLSNKTRHGQQLVHLTTKVFICRPLRLLVLNSANRVETSARRFAKVHGFQFVSNTAGLPPSQCTAFRPAPRPVTQPEFPVATNPKRSDPYLPTQPASFPP